MLRPARNWPSGGTATRARRPGSVRTASRDRSARIWDVASGQQIASLPQNGGIDFAIFSPDERRVLTIDDGVRLWDVATRQEIALLGLPSYAAQSASFNVDGTRVLTIGALADDGTSRLWFRFPPRPNGPPIHMTLRQPSDVRSVDFDATGTRVLTGSQGGTVRVWDATTGAQLKQLDSARS